MNYFITHCFQPICNLANKSIIGYEALLRDATSPETSPITMFKEADKIGHRNNLDRSSIKVAIDKFIDESSLLFVNIFPSTILKEDFLSWWDTNIPRSASIVIELSEDESIKDWKEINIILEELRLVGVKVAVDDMCSGYSSFQHWIELKPEFIKLDSYFIKGLSINPQKQKIVKSLMDIFYDTTKVIAEGVENIEDLYYIEKLGIPYGQGYYLGRPSHKNNMITIG